jgi:hypothetical protein
MCKPTTKHDVPRYPQSDHSEYVSYSDHTVTRPQVAHSQAHVEELLEDDLLLMDLDQQEEEQEPSSSVADVGAPESSMDYMQPESFRGPAPGDQEAAGSNVSALNAFNYQ